MDVKTAYLHVLIDCEIYIDEPEGYVTQSYWWKASLKVAHIFYKPRQTIVWTQERNVMRKLF